MNSISITEAEARAKRIEESSKQTRQDGSLVSLAEAGRRWQALPGTEACQARLLGGQTEESVAAYQGNIEHFVGVVQLPVGLAGPLLMYGRFAQGAYMLPLATTEAALVASYHRGSQVITEAGGCSALLLEEGVGRAPGFAFASLRECAQFVAWVEEHLPELRQVVRGTTRYGELSELRSVVEGNHCYLHFTFQTADAAGQNMATIATEAICAAILQACPIQPLYSFVEANLSSDKKASAQSLQTVRGRRVSAEVVLPARLVQERLHTTPERMVDFYRMGAIGATLSGTIGVQGHVANGLAALFIACGQDAACVAEAAIGVTRYELTPTGDLYATITLPNLIVGTVGGGTQLPTQRACLELMGLAGPGHARALAEVCAGLCLAGELSLIAALCAGHFTRAHKRLARERRTAL